MTDSSGLSSGAQAAIGIVVTVVIVAVAVVLYRVIRRYAQ